MKLCLWIFLAVLGSLCVCANVEAAPILVVDSNGILTGARNVTVQRRVGGGYRDELWDVEFVDGTCAQVFGGCSTEHFPFHQMNNERAFEALLGVVMDTSAGLFDSFPNRTRGCTGENVTVCGIVIPDELRQQGTFMDAATFRNGFGACTRVPPICPATLPDANGFNLVTADLTDDPNRVWARWTPSAIPESTSFGTLSIALLALLPVRHFRARTARRNNP
jgi:hypothetical protein